MQGKVIIFDCQLLQTKAWHRGMGKYTVSLLTAFLDNKAYSGEYEKVVFLFNNRLKYEGGLKKYAESRKNIEVEFLSLDVPIDGDQHSITLGQQRNSELLDEYINRRFSDKQVDFMITSLFLDEACPAFPSASYNSLIYYDLIPLMYYRLYLGLGASEQYFTRFSVLFAAHQIFAISETVANDITAFLGIPRSKVINIRGASNAAAKNRKTSAPKISVKKPYVLMPTGGDPRKNNLNGVKGFSKFNMQNGESYQLLITSIFTDAQKEDLKKYSPDIIFTDNVSDSELWWLYMNAEAILFPTEYEGLGMPILEAIDADKPIVCSDIAVFREISTNAFFMFDPQDPDAISAALEEVFSASPADIRRRKKHYPKISKYYTWDQSAGIVKNHLHGETDVLVLKPRIAMVMPNICGASEETRYFSLQFARLRETFAVDFYYDMSGTGSPVRPSYLAFSTGAYDLRLLSKDQYDKYDLVIYIINNNDTSTLTLQAALALPGLVITTNDSLDAVYESLERRGLMSSQRRAASKGPLVELEDASYGVVSLDFGSSFETLPLVTNRLAYEPVRKQGLYNKVFVNVDALRQGNDWNIDLIRDIASTVDKSRISFTIVARTELPERAFRTLDYPSVTLYEDVSDHEYRTLLDQADLYIDARPGGALEKLFPAAEAYRSGAKVILGTVNGFDGWYTPDIYVALDGYNLRDQIYSWLIRKSPSIVSKKAFFSDESPIELIQLIEQMVAKRQEEIR